MNQVLRAEVQCGKTLMRTTFTLSNAGLSKVAALAHQYIVEALGAYDSGGRAPTYFCFVDRSFLKGDYTDILTPDLYSWHVVTSQLNGDHWRRTGRRLFRRVLPLIRRRYSAEEVTLIKYSLHFQLTLGIEVWPVFTNQERFLEENFGSDNLGVIRGRKIIDSPQLYDSDAPSRLRIVTRPDGDLRDVYAAFGDILRNEQVHVLRYGQRIFTCFQLRSIKSWFGDFLFNLQDGRCAVTGERLAAEPWEVDHVYPRSMGGNNSLINLQVTLGRANREKSADLGTARYCLSPSQLARFGLATVFHRRLSDRTLRGVRPGWDAPQRLDWREL